MFGIGIPEIILIAIVALVVVGPKRLPMTLKAIGRGIAEFRRVSRQLREEAGFDEVVNEVTKPLREGMAEVNSEMQRNIDMAGTAMGDEYPETGPDDYGALPETAPMYPDTAPVLAKERAAALEAKGPMEEPHAPGDDSALDAKAPASIVRAPVEGTVARGPAGGVTGTTGEIGTTGETDRIEGR